MSTLSVKSLMFSLLPLVVACAPGGVADGDGRSAERSLDHIEKGMLVISELMIDPSVCPDTRGEWFEVTNLTDHWLQLEGLTVLDATYNRATLSKLELAPRARAVFGRGREETRCPEAPPAQGFFTGNIALTNTGDSLALFSHQTGLLIDQTPRFPRDWIRPGVSIQLSADAHDPDANDRLDAWYTARQCEGVASSTPGAPNEACGGGSDDRFEPNDTVQDAMRSAYFEVNPYETAPELTAVSLTPGSPVDWFVLEVEPESWIGVELDHPDVELYAEDEDGNPLLIDRYGTIQAVEAVTGQAHEWVYVRATLRGDSPVSYGLDVFVEYLEES